MGKSVCCREGGRSLVNGLGAWARGRSGGLDEGSAALAIDGVAPDARSLDPTPDDERVGVLEERVELGGLDPGTDEDGEGGGSLRGGDIVGVGGRTREGTGDNHAIRAEELRGVCGIGEGKVAREGVRGVFFLDVGEDLDAGGSQGPSATKEFTRGGVGEKSLVGDVGVHEVLDADELGVDGMSDRERLDVAKGEDLDAKREFGGCLTHGQGGASHGGDGLGRVGRVDIGSVVHVLDDDRVEAGVGEDAGFACGGRGNVGDALRDVRRGGQGVKVDHADEGAWGKHRRG